MALTVSDGFPYYISLTKGMRIKDILSHDNNMSLFSSFDEGQAKHRYAPGKWSIKQIVGHITDHERIMTYRTLRFSRKDKTLLPGYDQELMVDNAMFDKLPYADVLQDFKNVRTATVSFMNMLSAEQMLLNGTAWKFELTVDEMLRATIGHEFHHVLMLKERYLS